MKNNNPANFKLRLLAAITDDILAVLLFTLCIFFVAQQESISQAFSLFITLTTLVLLNPLIIFQKFWLVHYFGGTLGKLLTGLKITDENGNRLPFKRIFFRQSVGYSFSGLVFGLGFLSIAKDPQKQGWHDKTVGSKVVVINNLWPFALVFSILILSMSTFLFFSGLSTAAKGPLAAEAKVLWKQFEKNSKDEKKKTNNKYFSPVPSAIQAPADINQYGSFRFLQPTPNTNICLGQTYDIEWEANELINEVSPYLVSATNPTERYALYPEKKPFTQYVTSSKWRGTQNWTIGDVTDSSTKQLQVKPGNYTFAANINVDGRTSTINSSQFIISDCSDPNRPGSPNNPLRALP